MNHYPLVIYFAPEGFGYSSNQMTEGLFKLYQIGEIALGCSNKVVHHGAQLEDLVCHTEKQLLTMVDNADLILFSSDGDMKFLDGISGEVFRNPKHANKIVFLDGHDSDHMLADPEKMLMYLKREHRHPQAASMIYPNVRGFTFGVYQFLLDNMPTPGWDDRDIDICFIAFGGSNPARMNCAEILKHIDGQTIGPDRKIKVHVECQEDGQPTTIDEYRALMRRSKVGISIMGAGYDTLRYWETMAHGAVLCTMDFKPVMHIRNEPEPHRHALYFDSWNRMVELSRLVVTDRERWARMRCATDKLIQCHSTTNRARLMLEMARELA